MVRARAIICCIRPGCMRLARSPDMCPGFPCRLCRPCPCRPCRSVHPCLCLFRAWSNTRKDREKEIKCITPEQASAVAPARALAGGMNVFAPVAPYRPSIARMHLVLFRAHCVELHPRISPFPSMRSKRAFAEG